MPTVLPVVRDVVPVMAVLPSMLASHSARPRTANASSVINGAAAVVASARSRLSALASIECDSDTDSDSDTDKKHASSRRSRSKHSLLSATNGVSAIAHGAAPGAGAAAMEEGALSDSDSESTTNADGVKTVPGDTDELKLVSSAGRKRSRPVPGAAIAQAPEGSAKRLRPAADDTSASASQSALDTAASSSSLSAPSSSSSKPAPAPTAELVPVTPTVPGDLVQPANVRAEQAVSTGSSTTSDITQSRDRDGIAEAESMQLDDTTVAPASSSRNVASVSLDAQTQRLLRQAYITGGVQYYQTFCIDTMGVKNLNLGPRVYEANQLDVFDVPYYPGPLNRVAYPLAPPKRHPKNDDSAKLDPRVRRLLFIFSDGLDV